MTPPLVERAARLAAELGFANSCTPETGRLLHLLAASRGRSRVAETGTGVGYGAAWIVSALDPSVPFFTAELDEARAAAAGDLFRGDENVHVLAGDGRHDLATQQRVDLAGETLPLHEQPDLEIGAGPGLGPFEQVADLVRLRQMNMAIALAASRWNEFAAGPEPLERMNAWLDEVERRAVVRGADARAEAIRIARGWFRDCFG